tara:strand:- start:947 stop:1501 length:555 start_codon:yes stop_codon:yes gene_type:complete
MNFVLKRDKYCNYNFLVEFTNEPIEGHYFSCEGSVLKFAGCDLQTALYTYPNLPQHTLNQATGSAPEAFSVRLEYLSTDYLMVFLQANLIDSYPFDLLAFNGSDTVPEWIKTIYYLYGADQFRELYRANRLNEFKTTTCTQKLIEDTGDKDIVLIHKRINEDNIYLIKHTEENEIESTTLNTVS